MTPPYDPTPPQAVKTIKKKLWPAVLGGLLGLFLLLGGSRLFSGGSREESGTDTPAPSPGAVYEMSLETYRQALETRIAAICAEVAGAGQVQVIVSLAGGFEYVYAVDEKTASGGGSRVYVTVGSGSGKTLVFLTEKAPAIRGIGVVCTGGGDPRVQREITSLLCATFGVGGNCVFVTGRAFPK